MKAAVVYQSRWGNNQRIAQAITRGLSEGGADATLIEVDDAGGLAPDVDLLVVGAPTRAGRATGKIKKFIKHEVGGAWAGKSFAAFGTGLKDRGEKVEPKGADDVFTRLEAAGLKPAAPAFKATVAAMKGPLLEDEAERAQEFGRKLAAGLASGG